MKAAVLYSKEEMPQYVDLPDPVVQNDDEVLVSVKAVALKHFDKGRTIPQVAISRKERFTARLHLQLSGSGLGRWTKSQVGTLVAEILPEMFRLATAGKLKIETVNVAFRDIQTLWDMDVPDGKRLVVRM